MRDDIRFRCASKIIDPTEETETFMKTRVSFWIASACLLLAGCATTMTATSDFDETVDFSKYRTFSWIGPNPLIRSVTQRPLSPLVEQRLMTNTRELLPARGLSFVENPAEADLLVAFTIGSRDGIRIDSIPTPWTHARPTGPRRTAWRGYWPGNTVTTRQYTEGQLAVDMFDVAEARPVWHGTTGRQLTRSERESPDELLREALEAIFEKFPP